MKQLTTGKRFLTKKMWLSMLMRTPMLTQLKPGMKDERHFLILNETTVTSNEPWPRLKPVHTACVKFLVSQLKKKDCRLKQTSHDVCIRFQLSVWQAKPLKNLKIVSVALSNILVLSHLKAKTKRSPFHYRQLI